jgi:hypothetical protein
MKLVGEFTMCITITVTLPWEGGGKDAALSPVYNFTQVLYCIWRQLEIS